MIRKSEEFYADVRKIDIFKNVELLEEKVSNNQRYLRKIATIMNLGYYKEPKIIKKIKEINDRKDWGLVFEGNKLVISEETLDSILTVLQNKRLFSEVTEEDFDVESAKKYGAQPRKKL